MHKNKFKVKFKYKLDKIQIFKIINLTLEKKGIKYLNNKKI